MPQTVSTTGKRRRIPISPHIQPSIVQTSNADGTLYILGDNDTEHSWRLKALESPRRLVVEHKEAIEWTERETFLEILSSKSEYDRIITDLLGDTVSNNVGNVIEKTL